MDSDLAQMIVERYLLAADEQVEAVEAQANGTLVYTSAKEWLVVQAAPVPSVDCSFIELYPASDRSGARPRGVTLMTDGTSYALFERDGFARFCQRLYARLSLVDLAALLARYQGQGPSLHRQQNLIVQPSDLVDRLTEEDIGRFGATVGLRGVREADGALSLDFCTFFFAPDPATRVLKAGLNQWHAANHAGHLSWSVDLLVEGLPSPRYEPSASGHVSVTHGS